MLKYKPFPFSLFVLLILVAVHVASSHYSWYWTYPWSDTVVHLLGGLWVSLVILWLASYLGQINSMKEYKVKSLLIAIVSAGVIGVVWEVLENLTGLSAVSSASYGLDTAVDLACDVVGGLIAYLYFVRRTRCVKDSWVSLPSPKFI